jgi:hypothetical protein
MVGQQVECESMVGQQVECESMVGQQVECESMVGQQVECESMVGQQVECESRRKVLCLCNNFASIPVILSAGLLIYPGRCYIEYCHCPILGESLAEYMNHEQHLLA